MNKDASFTTKWAQQLYHKFKTLKPWDLRFPLNELPAENEYIQRHLEYPHTPSPPRSDDSNMTVVGVPGYTTPENIEFSTRLRNEDYKIELAR